MTYSFVTNGDSTISSLIRYILNFNYLQKVVKILWYGLLYGFSNLLMKRQLTPDFRSMKFQLLSIGVSYDIWLTPISVTNALVLL
jgi:hypothetical protein